jgi:hypothetical protein
MALSHVLRNVMVYQERQIEGGADMTSFELNDSDVVEVDGIQFRTVMPERVIRIPSKQPGAKTQVKFGIRITNNTESSQQFLLFFVRPEFLKINHRKLQRFGPNVNGSYNPLLSDFRLLMPKESVTLLLEGYFHWQHHKLNFVFREESGSYWIFSDFSPGTYWVQFTYENQYPRWEQTGAWSNPMDLKPVWEEQVYNNPRSDIVKMENVWVNEVSTPPIEFSLIQHTIK